MPATNASTNPQPNNDLPEILQQVLPDVEFQLTEFANREDFFDVIQQAFGQDYDAATLEVIQQQWQLGNVTLPPIKILSDAVLEGANGAYAAETNTIYFSREFLERHSDDGMKAIAAVWLEEIGHSIDAQINETDTPGDEGAIFVSLLQENITDIHSLSSLSDENDVAVLDLNGMSIGVEKSDDTNFSLVLNQLIQDGGRSRVLYMNGIRTVSEKFQTDLIGFNNIWNLYDSLSLSGNQESFATYQDFLKQDNLPQTFGSLDLDIKYRNTTDSTGNDFGDLGVFVVKFLLEYALDKFEISSIFSNATKWAAYQSELIWLRAQGRDTSDVEAKLEELSNDAGIFDLLKSGYELTKDLIKTDPKDWSRDDNLTANAFLFLQDVVQYIPGFGEISNVVDAAISAAPADLKEALEQYWYKETQFPEINDWIGNVENWLQEDSDNSLILLGHSQGNFFLEDALIDMGQPNRVSVLSLASPTSYLFAGGIDKYKTANTSSNDVIYGNDPVTKLRFSSDPDVWDKLERIFDMVKNLLSIGDHAIENYHADDDTKSFFQSTFQDLHPKGFYFSEGRALSEGYETENDDWIEGTSKNDNLNGGQRNDVIRGKGGDDTLSGASGYDFLDGGDGQDTADYSSVNQEKGIGVFATNYAGVDVYRTKDDGFGNVDTLLNIEVIKGTQYADEMYGGDGSDIFYGENGDDKLHGGDGDDELHGGHNNDTIYGDDGPDQLWGDNGDDTLHGGDDTDYLHGGHNNDTLYGGSDDSVDYLWGDNGNDTLHGGGGNDELYGGHNDDTLYGDAGGDKLEGNSGQDTISGGSGIDTIDGGDGDDTIKGDSGADIIKGGSGVDTIEGGSENDTIYGGTGGDIIYGQDGADEIYGQEDWDWISGGNGDDRLFGGDGGDEIYANAGNDYVEGGTFGDYIEGGSGLDTIYGQSGDDQIRGQGDADKIYGGTGDDELYGDSGNDEIQGNQGVDYIEGNDGSDRLFGNTGNDTVLGGSGEDYIEGNENDDALYGESGNDLILGGTGNDYIEGNDGGDRLFGESGDDYFIGGTGNDLIDGGDGVDLVDYQRSTSGAIVNIDESQAYVHVRQFRYNDEVSNDNPESYYTDLEPDFFISAGTALDGVGGTDTLFNLEDIVGTNYDDVLIGNDSDNHIQALDGNDLVIGNAGDDTLDGGAGIDTLSYRRDAGGVTVNLETGTATDGWGGQDTIQNFIHVVGSEHDDNLIGDAQSNIITGGKGDDRIDGGLGNDALYGERGEDLVIGNRGEDRIFGNQGEDTIYGDLEGVTDIGENDVIRGGDGDDEIHAGGGDDIVYGDSGYGDDRIWGDDGNDQLYGGVGNDEISGGNGNDYIEGNDGDDLVNGDAGDDAIAGNAGDDEIYGDDGNDVITGNEGEDYIEGNLGDDTISGGDDNDEIFGNEGQDLIFGDAGDDTIEGNDAADEIYGGTGNDDISGGDDNDLIFG
ncbi:MAG: hypothetical protein HC799_03895, partial [Limnothrix sp. RL_2_0]|nr:hypothetical protein [Limnothrix sp. RL_2_0]